MKNYFIILSFFVAVLYTAGYAQCNDKGSIVVSEVYFDTHFSEDISSKYHHFGEFIELFNSSNQAINLNGWVLKDNHTEFTFRAGYNSNSAANLIIQPGGIKIVTFSKFYNSPHDQNGWYYLPHTGFESPIGARNKFVELFPQSAGQEDNIILQDRIVLFNHADKVSLYNPQGRLIHEVSYRNGGFRGASDALNFMKISEFSLDTNENNSTFSNKDGGVFNGAIGMINVLDANGNPTYSGPGQQNPILFQSGLFQKSIYLSDQYAYYHDNPKTILIGQATPFTIPYSIPLLDAHTNLFSPPSNDDSNYVHTVVYDVTSSTNAKLVESRTYLDDFAMPTVTMSHDHTEGVTYASETVYDGFGRKSQSSYPTVVCNKDFKKINVLSNQSAKSEFLDSYYSNANTLDPYQATATHPYTEIEYDKLNPGNTIKTFGGNQIGGEWKSGYSYTVPAAQEMYYLYGYQHFEGPVVAGKEEISTKFFKTVLVDANGVENVAFLDGEGKTLAVARAGNSASITPYLVHSLIGEQGFVDVHIPSGITSGQITLIGGASLYRIYNLKTGLLVPASSLIGGNAYRIQQIAPFVAASKVYVTNASTGVLSYDSGARGVSYYVNYHDFTFNIYDSVGRLKKTVQPNGFRAVYAATPAIFSIVSQPAYISDTFTDFSTSYAYNTMGQATQVNSKDQGLSRFAYRKDGKIRYSQSALQLVQNRVSYTNYDNLSRPIESGVVTGASTIWNDAAAGVDALTMITGTLSERTFTIYDDAANATGLSLSIPSSLTLAALAPTYAPNQSNLAGNVAVTYSADAGGLINHISWYSYDIYGRIAWIIQYEQAMGTMAKTLDYEYDKDSNVSSVVFQKNVPTEKFAHRYTYDGKSRLIKTETAAGSGSFTEDAQYNYNVSGQLNRLRIGEIVQGIDYVYTLGGALKSINHPSLERVKDPGKDGLAGNANAAVTPDLFGITLDYFQGDYMRSGTNIVTSPSIATNYSGNIMASRWATRSAGMDWPALATTAQQKGYLYSYNRNNWLTDARFGDANSVTANINTPTAKHGEQGLQYDPNGNITRIQRTNNNAAIVDELTYNYTYSGTNQLNSVTDAVPATTNYPNDIDSGQVADNYVYNAIGQLTLNKQETTHYVYNSKGLVSEIRQGNIAFVSAPNVVKFYYNEHGHRTRKETYTNVTTLANTTYYILDSKGNTMAIYYKVGNGGAVAQTEMPIYGASRLGVYMKASNAKTYQLADHLGNVRAVAQRVVGSSIVTTLSYADYYPFGEQLQGRSSASNYRYAFQGQEKDGETGMESFQLRMWDGRLGRWLSPDPYGQYASPYVGMGNDPISSIDGDGGWETKFGAWWHGLWDGKDGEIFQSENYGDWGIKYSGTNNNGSGNTLDEVFIETTFGGKRYNINGYKATISAQGGYKTFGYSDANVWGFTALNTGYNFNSKWLDANVNYKMFNVGVNNYSGDGDANLAVSVEAYATAGELSGAGKIKFFGSEDYALEGKVNGKAFTADANLEAGVFTGENGKRGLILKAGAGAAALSGDVTGEMTIFGVHFNVSAGATAGSAEIGAGIGLYHDSNTNRFVFEVCERLAFIVGERAALKISF